MTSAPTSAANQSPKQVLYLDYDGVLHHDAVYRTPKLGIHIDARVAPGRSLFEWTEFLIHAISPYPDVSIVLSTSWVRVLGFSRALSYLPPELSSRVIGATYHRRAHKADSLREGGVLVPSRGVEVLRDVKRRQPQQWVAVDDSPEGWPEEHLDRVVLCDSTTGLGNAATRARLDLVLNHHFSSASVFSGQPVSSSASQAADNEKPQC